MVKHTDSTTRTSIVTNILYVVDSDNLVLKCYGWVNGGDGHTYGVCSDGDSPFVLRMINELRPYNPKSKTIIG